jgi:hypothetical protein
VETSLHRELKSFYADEKARFEVPLGRYRIDVVTGERLVEVQHGSLSAIRDKIRTLVRDHEVTVVKPIVVRKHLVKLSKKSGRVKERRLSPKRGQLLDLFDELVHFTRAFPHPRLTLDVLLVDIEELRYPGHGRRRRWRENDFQVEDQRLLQVHATHTFRTARDLIDLVPDTLPDPFHTGHLAKSLDVHRWIAQRVAYCLRNMGAVTQAGKKGNALLYRFAAESRARSA